MWKNKPFNALLPWMLHLNVAQKSNNLGDCTVHERKKHVQSVLHTYTCRLHLGLLNHVQTLIKWRYTQAAPTAGPFPSLCVNFSDVIVFPIRSFIVGLWRCVCRTFMRERKQKGVWLQRCLVQLLRLQLQLLQGLPLCFQSKFNSLHFSQVLLLQEQRHTSTSNTAH